MAAPDRALYNFYFRYKWNENDFAGWQDGMIGILRDTMGTIFGPAVISGGAGTAGGGMSVNVAAFVAVAPSGYLNVKNTVSNVLVTSDPSNPRKDLIVARKLLVDDTFISRPTSPFDSVPLKQLQETQAVRIAGTPAGSPVYPAKLADDVILFGVNISAGQSTIVNGNVDDDVRELLSGNTNFSNWVVARDIHGTAAITGDGSSVREALTVTGGNGKSGLKAVGAGTGAGTNDNAIETAQNIKFSGTKPNANTAFTKTLTIGNLIPAWGNANGGGASAPTRTSGFNFGSVTRIDNNTLQVSFAAALADAGYAVLLQQVGSALDDANFKWLLKPATVDVNGFQVVLRDGANAGVSTAGVGLNFIVLGGN